MNRRSFLRSAASLLAVGVCAPALVRATSLMPVKAYTKNPYVCDFVVRDLKGNIAGTGHYDYETGRYIEKWTELENAPFVVWRDSVSADAVKPIYVHTERYISPEEFRKIRGISRLPSSRESDTLLA